MTDSFSPTDLVIFSLRLLLYHRRRRRRRRRRLYSSYAPRDMKYAFHYYSNITQLQCGASYCMYT